MYRAQNQYHVVMEVAPQFWQSPSTLNDVYVHPTSGGEVPLGAVIARRADDRPSSVNHQGQFPSVTRGRSTWRRAWPSAMRPG